MNKYPRVEPEELLPGIFWPPVLPYFCNEAAAEQRFIEDVDHVGCDHEPKGDNEWNAGHRVPLRISLAHQYQLAVHNRTSAVPGFFPISAFCSEMFSCRIHRRWLTARIFPSVSLNHAVFAPPAVTMPFFIVKP